MGWFDEQIKQRIEKDHEVFEDSFINLTDSIIDSGASKLLYDERILTKNAIEDILKYYHIKIKSIPDSIVDVNEQLEWLLRPHGIMRRSVLLTEGWYKDAYGAMLLFTKEEKRAVALIPGRFGRYYYNDPYTGVRKVLNARSQDIFESEAICFYTPLPVRKLGIKDVIAYMIQRLNVYDVISVMIATALVVLVGMLVPMLNKLLFSEVVESKSIRMLVSMAVFMVCVCITNTLFGTIKTLVMNRISIKISFDLMAAGMMRVLSLPPEFFKKHGSGELAQRVSHLNELSDMIINAVFSTGITGLFSLVYIIQIATYAPALLVPSIVITLISFVLSLASTLLQMRYTGGRLTLEAQNSSLVYSIITGIQKIRLAGAEKRMFARWANMYSKEAKFTYNPPMFLKVNSVITLSVGLIGTIIIYAIAIRSRISVSDYYAFNSAYAMMSAAFMQISSIALSVAQIRPILDMLRPILETEPEVSADKEIIERITGSIELNNVSFRYSEDSPKVIDNLNLKIRPGQYVAICGATGCGKSTLMRLILGFETPQRGGIFFDGKNIKNIDMRSLRRKIGCVMQNASLLQGDIFSNIVISAPWLTLDDAWEAARLAGVADDIRALPMGMHTLVSEGQGGFSGGQKQRLMIARAIASKPRVVMLDEATSALDNITQRQVSESLDSLKCTRIVVAHRLSTIKHCDRIIVLDKGRIVEDGTYDELIKNNGFFAELVKRQRV